MNPISAIWILLSAAGLLFSLLNLNSALGDREAARARENARRRVRLIIADGAVFRARVRASVFAFWVILGIAFGFFDLPDIPRLAGLCGLLGTVAGLALTGYQEGRERSRIAAILRAEEVAARLAAIRKET